MCFPVMLPARVEELPAHTVTQPSLQPWLRIPLLEMSDFAELLLSGVCAEIEIS